MTEETVVQRDGVAADPAHGVGIQVGAFGPWQANAYLWDGHSEDALVLDPGMGASAALVARVADLGLRIHLVANSHGHIDHIFDNAAIKRASGAPLAIHPDDAYWLSGDNIYGQVEPSVPSASCGKATRWPSVSCPSGCCTPGHSEGSVCLYEADAVCCSAVTSSSAARTAGPICPAATTCRW